MEAMRESAAPLRQAIHVGSSYLGIVERMNRAEGQVVGDQEEKIRTFYRGRLYVPGDDATRSRPL